MTKIGKSILSGVVFSSIVLLPFVAIAQEINSIELETDDNAMAQITSVSELRDVAATEWAYEALQSLVDRYGCIIGYSDRTYRGNRALTRWEFAAGLNACMNTVERLIQENVTVFKEDIDTLKRLAQEFETELAALGARVDNLEGRVAFLEDNQFSTTTKLSGQIFFNLTGAFADDTVTAERGVADSPFAPPTRDPITNEPSRVQRDDPQITFSYYAFLNLTTSFTGEDVLVTQLVVGNGDSPANEFVSAGFYNSWGTPFLDQTGTLEPNDLIIRELSYTFPATDSLRITIGPRVNWYKYFDNNRFTFYLTGATSYNSNGSTLLNAVDRGSGAVVAWNITDELKFTAAYLAENTEFLQSGLGFNTSSNPDDGLFNSTYTISTELAYSPADNFNIRLHYSHSSLKAYNGFIGGAVGEPLPYGYADDGFGGEVNDATANAFAINFDWLITEGFGIFGRYSYGSTNIDPIDPLRDDGEVNVQSFQIGLGFPDLGKEGAMGVVSFVVPHDTLEGRRFLLSGAGDGGTQYELEASYYYPVTNNIAIVPAFYAIFNPNNFESNPTVFVGNLRTQFTF
ncbi:MAG: iron uptake porin [Hydrococcus sp. Prado102]|nr:iron uptake porin [Hydrococcus sp. Prado102]